MDVSRADERSRRPDRRKPDHRLRDHRAEDEALHAHDLLGASHVVWALAHEREENPRKNEWPTGRRRAPRAPEQGHPCGHGAKAQHQQLPVSLRGGSLGEDPRRGVTMATTTARKKAAPRTTKKGKDELDVRIEAIVERVLAEKLGHLLDDV